MSEIHFIGRSCRLPGASNVHEFADVLFNNRCVVSEIPRERWDHSLFYHPNIGTKGKSYSFAAAVLDDIWGFDPAVFNISPREASQMDPQQRILLQVVWEAIEDAGVLPAELAGNDVGVFVGASSLDYSNRLSFDADVADAYMMTGNTLSLVSNRISHAFDLRGPSMVVDTACSSSLVALSLAERALRSGEVDTAIVAGVNILLSPTSFIGFSAARMLSQRGLCQPFSANADGYVRAEGAVAFVLRQADIASLAPYRSYGKLIGVDTNTDGKTINVALPSAEGQQTLIRRLYEKSGVDPKHLSFVEAHGTGTLAGDPVEARALGQALGQFRTSPLLIGSVKSNFGHLEPASGVAGILKTLVALETKRLPASLHAETLNPAIPFEELNLKLATQTQELHIGPQPSYAGVSSFGFGGTNVHAIIEASSVPAGQNSHKTSPDEIFYSSAFCQDSLRELVARYRPHFSTDLSNPDYATVPNASAQALHFRGNYPQRVAVVCGSTQETDEALGNFVSDVPDRHTIAAKSSLYDADTVFVFSGNGAQYPKMSLAALISDQEYTRIYKQIDKKFSELSGWSLLQQLKSPTLEDDLSKSEIAQPLLFADQLSLAKSLEMRGLIPSAVLGHSGGEVAAACCSGALNMAQALMLIYQRSHSQMRLAGSGTMAALQVSAEQAAQALNEFDGNDISIAAVNSPQSVSLVGPAAEIDRFVQFARRKKRWACVRLKINYPYHGKAQDEIEAELRQSLAFINPNKSIIPFISSVTGDVLPGEKLGVDYWWSNVRCPVQFNKAINSAHDLGFRAFVEIGPQPVLANYIKDSLKEDLNSCTVTHSFEKKDVSEINPVSRSLARALVHGCKIDRSRIAPEPDLVSHDLPLYPWNNTSSRIDTSAIIEQQFGTTSDFHPLLGKEFNANSNVWLASVEGVALPQLADHKVGENSIAPGTYFAELAVAAAQRALNCETVELRDFDIIAPLTLDEGITNEVRTQVVGDDSTLQISSRHKPAGESWRDHVACRIYKCTLNDLNLVAPDTNILPNDEQGQQLYDMAREIGLNYGPAFQRVSHYRKTSDDEMEVVLDAGRGLDPDLGRIALDPIATDALFHGLVAYLAETEFAREGLCFVPVHIASLRVFLPNKTLQSGRIHIRRLGKKSIVADFTCFDETGEIVAELSGVRFNAVRILKDVNLKSHSYYYHLQPIELFNKINSEDTLSTSSSIETAIRKISTEPDYNPDDDISYLIEAASQRIAYDAVAEIADENGWLKMPDSLRLSNQDESKHAQSYFANVMNMLVRTELAEVEGSGWRLKAEITLPQTNVILDGILSDRPDIVPEYALLTRLQTVLSDLLSGGVPFVENEIFGRDAIDNVRSGSIFEHRRLDVLTKALAEFVAKSASDRALKIAELTDAGPRILPRMSSLLSDPACDYYAINVPVETGMQRNSAISGSLNTSVISIEAESDVLAQSGPFDLIIAPTILSRIQSKAGFWANMRDSLAKNGTMLVIEEAPSDFQDLVFGVNPDWFALSVSPEYPISRSLHRNQINKLLQSESFKVETSFTLPDGCAGATVLAAVTQPVLASIKPKAETHLPRTRSAILALLDSENSVAPIEGNLNRNKTAQISTLQLGEDFGLADGKTQLLCCIHSPDDTKPQQELLQKRLLMIADLVAKQSDQTKALWVVVPGGAGYLGCAKRSAAQSAIWATFRSVQNEYPSLNIRCIDVVPELEVVDVADCILELLQSDTPEKEIVIGERGYSALRVSYGVGDETSNSATDTDLNNMKSVLRLSSTSRLEELDWSKATRISPEQNEIEIEVATTGLNYRDVMWAMGVLPEEALENGFAGPTLGIESSGTIVRIGSNIKDFAIGDRVVTFGPGCFSSHLTIDQDWACRLLDNISLTAAATMPVAFFTAYYALHHLARLEPEDTVLIHGGAGGVGLAAIQIAQWRNSRIIATAGTKVKRDLLRSLGVKHVFNSRNLDFADQIREMTGGAGVDVVLNSLAGEAMELSLNCLAPFGRFLELGKQDFYTNTKVGLRPLKENLSYFGVDVDQILKSKPELAKRLFAEMMTLFEAGDLVPLPYRLFKGRQIVEAFRNMQKSAHIGKIVVTPEPVNSSSVSNASNQLKLNAEGAHIIIGGLGGLGFNTMNMMVRCGVKTIVLIGRSNIPSELAEKQIEKLRKRGIAIHLIACDISDRADLKEFLEKIRLIAPIRGVVHSAMVLEDMPLSELTEPILHRTLAAKVTGAENISQLTKEDALDYFVLYSSIATLIGNHGQSAYVAANGYIEGLARQRRLVGLPALAVGWGPISDAGYLTRDAAKAAAVDRFSGNAKFTARQALGALERLLAQTNPACEPVVYITPMSWNMTTNILKSLSGPTYRKLWFAGQENGNDQMFEDLRVTLMSLPAEEAEDRLVSYLLRNISKMLQISESSLTPTQPVAEMGMDSLIAVDLGLTLQKSLGDDIPMTAISETLSIRDIARNIVVHIQSVSGDSNKSDVVFQNLAAQHLSPTTRNDVRSNQAAE